MYNSLWLGPTGPANESILKFHHRDVPSNFTGNTFAAAATSYGGLIAFDVTDRAAAKVTSMFAYCGLTPALEGAADPSGLSGASLHSLLSNVEILTSLLLPLRLAADARGKSGS